MPNSERGEENKKKHLVFLEEETHHVVLVPVGWSMILICLERYVRASSSSPCWPPALSLFLLVSCWRPSRPPLSVSSSYSPSTVLLRRILQPVSVFASSADATAAFFPHTFPFPILLPRLPRPFINPPSLLPNPS